MTDDWDTSEYSYDVGACVEARLRTGVDIRDTQNRNHGHLSFGAGEWVALITAEGRG